MICATEGCENMTEGRTLLCASCNHAHRKAERNAAKEKPIYIIPKVSEKQVKKNKLYTKQRREHLIKHPHCQLRLQGCTRIAVEVHHSEGRGENTNKVESFMSACQNCHSIVHAKLSAAQARDAGFKK